MTGLGWQPWRDHSGAFSDAYVDWFHDLHGDRAGAKPAFVRQVLPAGFDGFAAAPAPGDVDQDFLAPDYMVNADFAAWWAAQPDPKGWLPGADDFAYPQIGSDDLVVGIVDTGLAMGHRCFRNSDGSSRILGAWQQGAAVKRDPQGTPLVPHLPLGSHLFAPEIDGALRAFSKGEDLTEALDQEGFNRATGLVDFTRAAADRALALRASHGTHVMGLAAGADPFDALEKKFSKRVRILMVSLPAEFAFGEGGAMLDYYLIYALRWLRETNARIADASGLSRPRPMVINISFGKHAGSGDAAQPFVKALINHAKRDSLSGDERQQDTGQPLHVIMPAGNSNLDRSQASFALAADAGNSMQLDWVVQPEDATSNFLEVWCEGTELSADGQLPLEIELVPPGQQAQGTVCAAPGQSSQLSVGTGAARQPLGRIYCHQFDVPAPAASTGMKAKFRYLVCLAPDRYQGQRWKAAPAGRWTLRLANRGAAALQVKLMVQTDQSILAGPVNARRAYLDDPTYGAYGHGGRLNDSYAYDFRQDFSSDPVAENLDLGTFVKRHGTLNAYAANRVVASIAGYRANDGRPADFSSTGSGVTLAATDRATPTAAFPTDDGYAHPGLLSQGSSDGSAVAMRGTSFASALATRQILQAWLDREHDPYAEISVESYLITKAQRQRPPQAWFTAPVQREKQGAGRIVPKASKQVSRF